MTVNEVALATTFSLPPWSAAEFLDMPYSDGFLLRVVICRLGPDKWQWSIMAIEAGSEGQLIGVGTEKTVAGARLTAASELDKCMRDPCD